MTIFFETIIAFNNEIISTILSLKLNRKPISKIVFSNLNFALLPDCYEKLLVEGFGTIAEKWIEQ